MPPLPDPRTVSEVKDKAEAFFNKGKFGDALAAYETIRDYGVKDPKIFQRIGDISRKVNDTAGAVGAYKKLVDVYVKQGFVIKAIAVGKVIVQLDPKEEGVQKRLAELYAAANKSPEDMPQAAPEPPAKKLPPLLKENMDPPAPPAPQHEAQAAPASKPRPQAAPPKAAPPAPAAVAQTRAFPRTLLFSDFTKEELFEVIKRVRYFTVETGAVLFKEGDRGDSIFVVVLGELAVTAKGDDGSEVRLAGLKDGETFGEFGFFSGAKRTSTVKALTPAELLEVKKSDMAEIISRRPRVEKVLFEFYKERVVDRLMALSYIFSPMTVDDRKEILKRANLKAYRRGELIMREGDMGDTMYLIQEGQATVWTMDESGGRRLIGELHEGEFFGEIALATAKPRVANVSAATDIKAVEYSREVVKDILDKYPEIKIMLQGVIKDRVTGAMKVKKGTPSSLL